MTMAANEEVSKENLEHLLGVNHIKGAGSSHKDGRSAKSKHEGDEPKPSVIYYKYSNDRKGPLHESVITAGLPKFIKYENEQVKAVEHIEEPSRIIRPPRKEEYPYPPYEFANMDEVHKFINEAKTPTFNHYISKQKKLL